MNLDELRICLGTGGGQDSVHRFDNSTAAQGTEGEMAVLHGREPPRTGSEPLQDRLAEIEMAARLGYLLCQCTWPPQIMVLGDDGQLFRCPRCRRRRDF